jgi:plasmid stabilization system protein ParE
MHADRQNRSWQRDGRWVIDLGRWYYLIFYRIEAERVVLVHVLHGAWDHESLLFPDQ